MVTVLEEFKEKLRQGEIFEALTIAMSEAIELKVTTWVSPQTENPAIAELEPSPGRCLHTRINIVDGEVENEIGSEFIGNEAYAELQKFHLEQVREGREILLKNLESLQQMFAVLSNTMSELPQSTSPRLEQGYRSISPVDRDDL
jgi:hypothetical protein